MVGLTLNEQSPTVDKVLLLISLSLLDVLGVIGNLLILLIIIKTPHLRNLTHILVSNLCILDLMCSLLAMPVSIISISKGKWTFGDRFCFINGFFSTFLCSGSITTICIVSIERYVCIAHPMSYAVHSTNLRGLAIVAYIWSQSTILGALPLVGINKYVFNGYRGHCSFEWEQSWHHVGYVVVLGIMCFLLPSIIILVTYCKVLRIARQTTRQVCPIISENSGSQIRPGVPINTSKSMIVENGRSAPLIFKNGNSRVSLRGPDQQIPRSLHRLVQSNSGDSKATRVVILLLGAFFICWTPFFALHVHGVLHGKIKHQLFWERTTAWMAFSSSAINPFLYGLLNRHIRQEIVKGFDILKRLFQKGVPNPQEESHEGPEDFFQFLERTNTTTLRNNRCTDFEVTQLPGQIDELTEGRSANDS
ncbi:putative G-protein coupled receptor [Holothuria leucospilota]|uniref:G-protein coupled receptor n=1 Tax=Holothuria leucospilota TaxID=206669 RepID=A0A9Q1HJ96_HOLLE|nr:putative G-protein coupled receptor [Holothuria leucospilota]